KRQGKIRQENFLSVDPILRGLQMRTVQSEPVIKMADARRRGKILKAPDFRGRRAKKLAASDAEWIPTPQKEKINEHDRDNPDPDERMSHPGPAVRRQRRQGDTGDKKPLSRKPEEFQPREMEPDSLVKRQVNAKG